MDLTLKGIKKENASMSALIKQMCSLKCRSKIDVEEGAISIFEI